MYLTLGLLVTAIFYAFTGNTVYFRVLAYIGVFGLAWDVVFILLQQLRWDRDWPAVLQVISGVVEGAFVFLLIQLWGLPGIARASVPFSAFVFHYGLVWLVIFIWVQGPMRAIFPRWRFHGGQVI
jgi:hypothetical protein